MAGERGDGHAAGLRRAGTRVQETLKRDPHCGHLFVFRGKRGGLTKVPWHDGQGMCLFAKRLERGRFVWPRTEGEAGDDHGGTARLPAEGHRHASPRLANRRC